MRAQTRLPAPRPMLWPLRPADSAIVSITVLPDGRRRIKIRHAELKGVTPEMLAWWFRHIEGEMLYAGRSWPRYLVWHPRDHISYEVVKRGRGRRNVSRDAQLHVREAFQRDPHNLLDVTVTVERIDSEAAIIGSRVLGASALRLCNCFQQTQTGTRYVSIMTIGSESWLGRCGLNWLLRSRILAGHQADAWIKHHIEEVGNLENFLPALYAAEGDRSRGRIEHGARRTAA
jgi:hypothetical protein